MIQLNRDAVIMQITQNNVLIEQSRAIMESALRTEANTQLISKYSEIAAINSELSVKIAQAPTFTYGRFF